MLDKKAKGDRQEPPLDVRLARARSNPVRSQILDLIQREPRAASELEQLIGQPIRKVSVHLKTLQDLELIEPNHRELEGNATKTSFRTTREVSESIAAETPRTDHGMEEVTPYRLVEFLQPTTVAVIAEPKKFGPRQMVRTRTVMLDEIGCAEMANVLANTRDQILDIKRNAAARIEASRSVTPTLSVLCVESLTR